MNVLLPQPIEVEAVRRLEEAGHTVVTAPDPTPETVLPLMKNAHAVVLRTGITMTRGLIEAADDLRVISRTGGGFDNVDVEAATDNEIIVTSNLGVNSISVCEHVLAMMLSLAKQLPLLDRAVRNDNYSIRYQNLSRDLNGKTIGLLGLGRIGFQVATACASVFKMRVLACDPYLADEIKSQYTDLVAFVDKKQLCKESDVISVHVPLTDETHHALSTAEFELMKSEAIVINTSRGPVIDEDALIDALEHQIIGGAGLDVQNHEPPDPKSPLLKLDKVLLTPHSAALTNECVIRMATDAADRTIEVLSGKKPLNVANPEVLGAQRWQHLASS
ncbi:MAG: hydroxyacid dehydrogenase [Desulfofustis sp.]|nr:hydroxyacid dehydrogenase [Desulfofustis sp.]